MDLRNGLTQRKHILQEDSEKTPKEEQTIDEILKSDDNIDDNSSRETKLTLMEELLLLGTKNKGGYTSFWNDLISTALRGSILIELGLCERIQLEPTSLRRKDFASRKIILISDTLTGDVLLDETIRHIKSADQLETVKDWIRYLNGESWNPFKIPYRLTNVRERIAKNLAEKGILTMEKTNFFLFDLTTHPVIDPSIKIKIIKKIQDALLSRWVNDAHRINKRTLALIFLAYYSELLEKVFVSVGDSQYDLVSNRIRYIHELDFEEESKKPNSCEIVWAVLEALLK